MLWSCPDGELIDFNAIRSQADENFAWQLPHMNMYSLLANTNDNHKENTNNTSKITQETLTIINVTSSVYTHNVTIEQACKLTIMMDKSWIMLVYN